MSNYLEAQTKVLESEKSVSAIYEVNGFGVSNKPLRRGHNWFFSVELDDGFIGYVGNRNATGVIVTLMVYPDNKKGDPKADIVKHIIEKLVDVVFRDLPESVGHDIATVENLIITYIETYNVTGRAMGGDYIKYVNRFPIHKKPKLRIL